jgi:D-alanyl-D-alanine carboxypeptidase
MYNSNRLLRRYPDLDGLKTGHIARSGYHIIATAKKGDARMIAVVMGCRNIRTRDREAIRLLEAGFRMAGPSAVKLKNGERGDRNEAT